MTRYADACPLFLTEADQFGGAERSLLALARRLYERGRESYLLTYRDRFGIASYANHPLDVVALEPGHGVRRKIGALRAHLRERPSGAPAPLLSGYQPALHASLAGARGFHTLMHDTPALFAGESLHTMRGRLRTAVSNRIAARGLRSGGATIVNSTYLQSECRRDFGVTATIVRMGGHTREPVCSPASAHPVDRSRLHLLSVSRLEPNKRIDWILRALARLWPHGAAAPDAVLSHAGNWRLDVVGAGSMELELQALAASLGLSGHIRFHGFVADAELEALYAEADLFLMPAVQGYGLPALEAIERGVPVLLHRESGVSDILLETAYATVMEGGEPELAWFLAKAIRGVLEGSVRAGAKPLLPTEATWADKVIEVCGWA